MAEFYDALIIGGGIAGASAALFLAETGHRVLLVIKGDSLEKTNTFQAQGGIVFRGENDSWERLAQDIVKATDFTAFIPTVRMVSKMGPPLVKRALIEKWQVPFERDKEGKWDLFQEGAHSLRRILHVKDHTGQAIQAALSQAIAEKPLIEVRKETFVLELITSYQHAFDFQSRYLSPECLGAFLLNTQAGEVYPVLARSTFLATGGLGEIYQYTSGGSWNTGDGFALAYRAGANLRNMEFVQFHPTLFYVPGQERTFLISESVRGEGGELTDHQGKPFMSKYHPLGSLAPRDVVARAVFKEMKANKINWVYLDLTRALSPAKIKDTFPTIYERCLSRGIDITKQPIPVIPGAHFACGGVLTDTFGRTNLKRLYAIGEVACSGLHGANRLASTSLLEGLTFAYRAARDFNRSQNKLKQLGVLPFAYHLGSPPPNFMLENLKQTLKMLMWHNVGLSRHKEGLTQAMELLGLLQKEVLVLQGRYGVSAPLWELINQITTAQLVTESAWKNRLSRGTHYRSDSLPL
ncbi:MAG: L-aspartate oxidase [Candidatus Atribacteria bacterium]|nr:L-aspartate oxidase [Candidatus Atribacteria bacterium]